MIETLFTFYLVFALGDADMNKCKNVGGIDDACYIYDTKTIYVNKETKRTPKDFSTFHEGGHHIFKFDFDKTLFSDEEVMADQFALFIYIQKYAYDADTGKKIEILRKFQRDDRYEYFKKYCDKMCVNGFLSIEIPDFNGWTKDFKIRD